VQGKHCAVHAARTFSPNAYPNICYDSRHSCAIYSSSC
jgi:hypothetical protein